MQDSAVTDNQIYSYHLLQISVEDIKPFLFVLGVKNLHLVLDSDVHSGLFVRFAFLF